MTRTLTYLLYRLLQALAFPVLLLYLVHRILKNRAYARRIGERLGLLPASICPTLPGAVWLHAVSVGEVIAAIPLIRGLKTAIPDAPVYVSVSTLAGRAMADQKLAGLADGVFYAPLDYVFAIRRVLRRLRPALLVIMETEIWPNMMREAKRAGAGVLIVNARISDKALPRYRRYAWFFRQALAYCDSVLAQDETASRRYREIGAEDVQVTGNLKYDFDPNTAHIAPELDAWIRAAGASQVLIAASTMPPAREGDVDEDDLVIDAWKDLAARHPDRLLILVPRRPERFETAAKKLLNAGIEFTRRTSLGPPCRVLLLDTIGELNGLFRYATLVFMGGTVAERGGHNILEPAAFGAPVICGPHMENFAEIAAEFERAGALPRLDQTNFLFSLSSLLEDKAKLESISKISLDLAESKRGATVRLVEILRAAHDRALPRPIPPSVLLPFSWLWLIGVAIDRSLKRLRRRKLEVRTISVGNLAAGGTGKTPMVIWLCREFEKRGLKAGVLTRGYRRTGGPGVQILSPGDEIPLAATGEEPGLILQKTKATVGIGSDRWRTWQAMNQHDAPDVVLLDDGFQHWRLDRDADIVLIDALNPFRGGLLPLGRLREPFSALKRSTAVVITRSVPDREYAGLIVEIRRHNPDVPVFRARTAARRPEADLSSFGAFCGLGQPEAFRRTLKELGLEPVFFEAFPDHHHYAPEEITALKSRSAILVTTEKDLFNVPEALRESIHPIPIEMALDDADGLLAVVSPPRTP